MNETFFEDLPFHLVSIVTPSLSLLSTGSCSPTLSVSATDQPLVKSVNVAGFTVGSSVDLSYSTNVFVSALPSGSSVTVDVYAYTTLYFRCQTDSGACPFDSVSTAPPLTISSPFDVFEGVCNADMNGFFLVCLYAGNFSTNTV